MKIAITGSTGLIGQVLISYFRAKGDNVVPLLRRKTSGNGAIFWDPVGGSIEKEKLEGVDAVIHLAGANIAGKRWTESYKKEILSSRVESTKLLSATLARLNQKPKVFISASAIGYYGQHEPSKQIDESSPPADDYLADVCTQWEDAASIAKASGIRVIHPRIGVVLSRDGGALAKMLPAFKMGLGGRLGSGEQMMPWIALDDIPSAIDFMISQESVSGAVNLTAPNPASNAQFTKALGQAIKRPTIFPVPAFGVKLLFGEMGDALLLGGAKVVPRKLLEAGYKFKYPDLESALKISLKPNRE